jgi:hypothetical protein
MSGEDLWSTKYNVFYDKLYGSHLIDKKLFNFTHRRFGGTNNRRNALQLVYKIRAHIFIKGNERFLNKEVKRVWVCKLL